MWEDPYGRTEVVPPTSKLGDNDPWTQELDSSSGYPYWYNKSTGESSWEDPRKDLLRTDSMISVSHGGIQMADLSGGGGGSGRLGSPVGTPLGDIGEDEEAEYDGPWGRTSSAELGSDYGGEREPSRGPSLSGFGRISSFFMASNPMRGDSTASSRSPSRGPSLSAFDRARSSVFGSNPMAQNPVASRSDQGGSGTDFTSTNLPGPGGGGMGPPPPTRNRGAKGEQHLSIHSDMGMSHAL